MIDLTNDAEVLAATVWGEARGEPLLGQQAVAAVVANRMRVAVATGRKQFGDGSAHSACLKPYQFSCWNEDDPNRAEVMALDFATPDVVLAQCLAIATEALVGSLADPTGGACFYKALTLPWPKDWGAEEAPTVTIGRHAFYKLGVSVPPPTS